MIDILGWIGWICTVLVLLGYFFNSNGKTNSAFIVWICGDFGWIWYDYCIDNWSHATLSTVIILINVYGLYRKRRNNAKQ